MKLWMRETLTNRVKASLNVLRSFSGLTRYIGFSASLKLLCR
jgi:hypothetical protein